MGWDIMDIKHWLRHSSIDVTADIYTHISQNRKANLSKKLAGTFEPLWFLLPKMKKLLQKMLNLIPIWLQISRKLVEERKKSGFAPLKHRYLIYHQKSRKALWEKKNPTAFRLSDFGLSDKTWTCGLYHPNGPLHQGLEPFSCLISEYRIVFRLFDTFLAIFVSSQKCTLVQNDTHYAQVLCTELLCNGQIRGLRHFYINSETVICQVLFL